jgi:hypothetical protein
MCDRGFVWIEPMKFEMIVDFDVICGMKFFMRFVYFCEDIWVVWIFNYNLIKYHIVKKILRICWFYWVLIRYYFKLLYGSLTTLKIKAEFEIYFLFSSEILINFWILYRIKDSYQITEFEVLSKFSIFINRVWWSNP